MIFDSAKTHVAYKNDGMCYGAATNEMTFAGADR